MSSKPVIESLEHRLLLSAAVTPLHWNTAAPMPVPRAEGGSFVADGRLYTFGGFNDAQLHISTEMDYYDPAANKWTRVADCPVRVNDDPVAVDPVTDTAWIGGFYLNDGFHPSPLVYSYDIKNNKWTQGPSLPANIGAGGMGVVGRELHYWGGRDKNNVGTTAHWRLNLDNVSAGWVADAPIPLTTNHVGTAVVAGKLYSIGGIVNKNENHSNENNVWIYTPATRTWTAGASMPFGVGHIASAVAVWNDQIIVAGGEVDGDNDVMTKAVLDYDTTANTWARLTDLPDFRQSSFVAAVGDKLIITGGNTYQSPYINATTWTAELTPATTAGGGTTGGGTTGGATGGANPGGGTAGGTTGGGTTGAGNPGNGTTGATGSGDPTGGSTGTGTGGGTIIDPVPAPLPTDPNGPDLTGSIRAHLPVRMIDGAKNRAIVVVQNSGPAIAVGHFNITLALSLDGSSINSVPIGSLTNKMLRLRPTKAKAYRIGLAVPADMATGTYTLIAIIDSGNNFLETTETNNIAIGPTIAVDAQSHDVATTSLLAPPVLHAARVAHLKVEIQNTGNMPAIGDIRLTLTAAPVPPMGVASIQPMEVISITRHIRIIAGHIKRYAISFRVPAAWIGPYQLNVTLAPVTVVDSNLGNNIVSVQVPIQP